MAAAPLTPEDLYRFRWIDHVRLTRDGERVAYQVSWADADGRQARSRVVIRRLLDPEPVEPTGGVKRDHSPEWSPDERKLAFLSRVGPKDQLFIQHLTGTSTAIQLSSIPDGVGLPRWSPDGKWIAFLGAVLADTEAVIDDPRPPDGREQLRRAPIARVVSRLDYKHDGRGYKSTVAVPRSRVAFNLHAERLWPLSPDQGAEPSYGEGNSSFDLPDNQYAKSAIYSLRATIAFPGPRKSTGSACTENPAFRKAPIARAM